MLPSKPNNYLLTNPAKNDYNARFLYVHPASGLYIFAVAHGPGKREGFDHRHVKPLQPLRSSIFLDVGLDKCRLSTVNCQREKGKRQMLMRLPSWSHVIRVFNSLIRTLFMVLNLSHSTESGCHPNQPGV